MGLDDLAPVNSKRAKATALNTFRRFLADESVDYDQVVGVIKKDSSGKALCTVLEKYGLFLLRQQNRQSLPLAKNSVLSYFGQTKNELLMIVPEQEVFARSALVRMTGQIDKFCAKRVGAPQERQAPPCTKQDLVTAVTVLYKTAANSKNYFDAGLINLMWFLFGRSSDTAALQKAELSVYPGEYLWHIAV